MKNTLNNPNKAALRGNMNVIQRLNKSHVKVYTYIYIFFFSVKKKSDVYGLRG